MIYHHSPPSFLLARSSRISRFSLYRNGNNNFSNTALSWTCKTFLKKKKFHFHSQLSMQSQIRHSQFTLTSARLHYRAILRLFNFFFFNDDRRKASSILERINRRFNRRAPRTTYHILFATEKRVRTMVFFEHTRRRQRVTGLGTILTID